VLKTRSLAALFALSLGIVLMVSLVAQTILEFLPKQFFYNFNPQLEPYRWIFSLLGPPLLLALVFELLFKVLLGRRASWKNVWPGAILTTILYWVKPF
jgi:membrane protein